MSFALISILIACIINHVFAIESNSRPVRPNDFSSRFLNKKGLLITGVSAAAATGFKYYYNGPVFNEPVNLQGYNCVVTGANTGLGYETAVKLADLGAKVLVLCKTKAKGETTCENIKKRVGDRADVVAIALDLASLKSVDDCAREISTVVGGRNVDILVNNAGVMAIPERTLTTDGFEAHMGINHLGHFALTSRLLPLLENGGKGKGARIVNVASEAHRTAKLDLDDIMIAKEGTYQPWIAYGNSKLANILFTRELNKRLRSKGSKVITTVCHPGLCRTDLGRYFFDPERMPKVPQFVYPVLGALVTPITYFTKSSQQGAQTQIYLSASTEISPADSGKYFDNSRPSTTTPEGEDMVAAGKLWSLSEKFIGRAFGI